MIRKRKPIAALSSVKSNNLKIRTGLKRSAGLLLFWGGLTGLSFIFWYRISLRPAASIQEYKIFVIPKGQPAKTILWRLKEEGLIRSSTAADIFLYFSNQRDKLQAGAFRLSPSMSAAKIVEELKHGTIDVWVTIPEGFRAEQVADELLKNGLLTDHPPESLYQSLRQLEGKLFPDTYLFSKDSSPEQVINRMVDNFNLKTAELSFVKDSDVILASLIEREAKNDADRALISGVLKNRLKIGMPLQVDATLQYAKAAQETRSKKQEAMIDWWSIVSSKDKNIDSPYNTYKFPGLPPRPIANPGLPALTAALHPAETNYLYYISEPDGTTHYAKTLEGHNRNIAKYLMR